MTGANDPTWLDWFHRLTLVDQVAILADPHGALPVRLIDPLGNDPGVTGEAFFVSNWTGPGDAVLNPMVADRLADLAARLGIWWGQLSAYEQQNLMDHRAGELSSEQVNVVADAVAALRHEPNPLVVEVRSDPETGRFSLPPLIRAFVEWQARSSPSQ